MMVLRGNGEPHRVSESDLEDSSSALAYCRAAAEHGRIITIHLQSERSILRPEVRCLLLNIQAIEGAKVRYRVDQTEHDDLLRTLLALKIEPRDLKGCQRHLSACIEIAASTHPTALDLACSQIRDTFHTAGVRGLSAKNLLKKAVALSGGRAGGRVTPRQAAELYLAHRRQLLEVAAGAPCVLFQDDEFWVYQGTHWAPVSDNSMAAGITRYMQRDLNQEVTKSMLENVLVNLRGLCFFPSDLSGHILRIEPTDPPSARQAFAISLKNGLLVPAQDGVLNGQLELIPHDPRYLVRSSLPYEFDPIAECPLWRQTLDEILPRCEPGDHRQEVVEELISLSLVPQAARLETAGILVGEGANGKSTILSMAEAALGSENVAHIPLDQLGDDFRLNELRGKHANISGDMNRMDRVAEGLLKGIISGDPVSVNRKFKSPVTLRIACVFLFATNELPQFLDASKGIWRRLRIIPFLESFEGAKRDIHRIQKLKQEVPGIINSLLTALQRLLTAGAFTHCTVCERALAEHRLRSDPVLSFLEECTNSATAESVEYRQLYLAYREYCDVNGRRPLSNSEFGSRMSARGIKVVRPRTAGARQRHYQGINLDPSGHELAGNQKLKRKLI